MSGFVFTTTRQLISEPGSVSQLGELCLQLGMQTPVIITDPGIVKVGLLEQAERALKSSNLPILAYADVQADPPESVVLAAVQYAIDQGADGIIGYGGGSAMDTAKLVALLACSGEQLSDIYGVDQVRGQRLPLIQVPTTAGTGSEVTPIAIVTTGASTKMGVVSGRLQPDVALLDAELTLGLPAGVTASTGVDAMVHAIEAYTSRHKKNPYSDMLAHQALRLLSTNIRQAVAEPGDLSARQNMLLGAMMAGQAFANAPVAAVHALAYPLGGQFHISHGLSNSLVLPEVMRFNISQTTELYAELAPSIMGNNVPFGSDTELASALIEYIAAMIAELGLPTRLRDVDIPESALNGLAEDAMGQQRLLINNPRDVEFEDALAIYKAAY